VPGTGEAATGKPLAQSFKEDDTKRVGPARKDEHVRGGIDRGQPLARAQTKKHDVGILLLQLAAPTMFSCPS
jgi:hypothetical protein